MVGALFTIITVGITTPYTVNRFNTLLQNGDENIKAYTTKEVVTDPFEFTVGESNELDFNFRFTMAIVDSDSNSFPADFERIGRLEV